MRKKAFIVMLPVTEEDILFRIVKDITTGTLSVIGSTVGDLVEVACTEGRLVGQHLYTVTRDEAEEGEWCYHTPSKSVVKLPKGSFPKSHYRKVIATTDPKLIGVSEKEYTDLRAKRNRLRDDSEDYSHLDYIQATKQIKEYDLTLTAYEKRVPQLQQSFLKEYVANPDGEFEVEYSRDEESMLRNIETKGKETSWYPTVDEDNEIAIYTQEWKKIAYSREEILDALSEPYGQGGIERDEYKARVIEKLNL